MTLGTLLIFSAVSLFWLIVLLGWRAYVNAHPEPPPQPEPPHVLMDEMSGVLMAYDLPECPNSKEHPDDTDDREVKQ
jgi:hypothetical protein